MQVLLVAITSEYSINLLHASTYTGLWVTQLVDDLMHAHIYMHVKHNLFMRQFDAG